MTLLRTCLAVMAVVATALLLTAAAQAGDAAMVLLGKVHKDASIACTACHGEQPAASAPPHGVCIGCHGGAGSIAARTADLVPNPHVSPHLADGEAQPCTDCYHVHAPQEVTCVACHKGLQLRRQPRRRGNQP